MLFDDGVVVYLNGIEVYRNNMPAGAIGNATLATQAIPVENSWNAFSVDKSFLISGINTWAIEVHQSSAASSDISFDFQEWQNI